MPRARKTDGEETTTPAPRARRPRSAAATTTRVRRSRVTNEESSLAPSRASEPARKAPTPFQSERAARKKSRYQLVSVLALALLLTGAGVVIGYQDKGAINVATTLTGVNEKLSEEGGQLISVPVQNTGNVPNGGLRQADAPTPAPTPEPILDTASSSASSTDENVDESDAPEQSTEETAAEDTETATASPEAQ